MKLSRNLTLVFIGFFSIISNFSFTQLEPEIYTYRFYDSEDGLPQSQVLDLIDDDEGMIISTTNGIFKFDGQSFYKFIEDDFYKKIFYNRIFYDKKSKNLYGWTRGKKYCRIAPSYEELDEFQSLSQKEDTLIGITNDGLVKLFSYDSKTIIDSFYVEIERPLTTLTISKSDKKYYVSDSVAIYEIDAKTKSSQILKYGVFDGIELNPYKNELVLFESSAGIIYFIGDTITKEYKLNDFSENKSSTYFFNSVYFFSNSDVIVSGNNGLYYFTGDEMMMFNARNSFLKSPVMRMLYMSKEGIMFVGTESRGLMKFTPNQIKTFVVKENEMSNSFTGITKDENDNIYSSGPVGNVLILKNGEIIDSRKFDLHIATLSYIDKEIFIGTWGAGLQISKDLDLRQKNFLKIFKNYHVKSVFEDSEKNIWVGSENGLYIISNNEVKSHLLEEESFITFYELSNGNICAGTTSGVFIFNKEGKVLWKYGEEEGLKCKEVRSFYEDDKKRIWIGTYSGGVYVIDHRKLVSINNMKNCMLYEDAFTLVNFEDVFYMTSNNGIWAVDAQELYDFYEGKSSYLIPEFLGKEIGLKHTEFNGGFGNNYLIDKDKIYFPSINGLIEFSPDKLKKENRALNPIIHSVIQNDTLIINPMGEHLVFSRNTHTLRFDFYCPTYAERFNLHFQYKLEGKGIDQGWSVPEKMNFISLKLLPPGDYVFLVRGIDSANDQNPKITTISFTIEPHFYETNAFLAIVLFTIIIVILLIIRQRISYLNLKNKTNNTLLELKLDSIQSKLDPHFIFNSLNNVIYLLNIEKYDEAEELLQDFSLLLRQYIEKNNDAFTSIDVEMQIMELYLSIQQKRYNHNFDFKIDYPEKLGSYEIPTRFIQPFVENAILHGLAHIVAKGILQISIQLVKQDIILIKIEDNGIGRKRSQEINKNRNRHESKGLLLINEKARVLREKYGVIVTTKITDIEDDWRTGTIVTIRINDGRKKEK